MDTQLGYYNCMLICSLHKCWQLELGVNICVYMGTSFTSKRYCVMGMCASLLCLGKKILWGCLLVLELVSQKLVWIVEKRIVGFISDRWTDQRSCEYIIFALGEAVCNIIFWCRFDFYLASWPSPACGLLVLCLFAALSNSYFFSFAKQSLFYFLFFVPIKSVPFSLYVRLGGCLGQEGTGLQLSRCTCRQRSNRCSVRVEKINIQRVLCPYLRELYILFLFFFQDFYVICPDH